MSPVNQVAKIIKEGREAKGWSQQELADKLGWQTKQSVSRIENGRQNLSLEMLEEVCRVLGITEVTIRIPARKR